MVEAESAGQILEPGGISSANTRLEVIARGALSDLLPSANVEEICKNVTRGSLTLEDLDKLAEVGGETGKGVVVLVFGTSSTEEVSLEFLSSDKYDNQLKEKNGLSELLSLFKAAYGFESSGKDLQNTRKEFTRYVLLSDFLSYVADKSIHNLFEKAPKAIKKRSPSP